MSNEIKLSIIVPYHNEDDSVIFPLFNSLNNQIDINFDDIEIIVSNNCEIINIDQFSYVEKITGIKDVTVRCR